MPCACNQLRQLLAWTLPYLRDERLYEQELNKRRRRESDACVRDRDSSAMEWNEELRQLCRDIDEAVAMLKDG